MKYRHNAENLLANHRIPYPTIDRVISALDVAEAADANTELAVELLSREAGLDGVEAEALVSRALTVGDGKSFASEGQVALSY